MHYPSPRDRTARQAEQAVSSGRGDDRGAARGNPVRADDLRRGRSALHRPRACPQRSGQPARHGGRGPRPGSDGRRARDGAPALPHRNRQGVHRPARSRQVQGPGPRIRAHGGDRLRSRRAAAVRDDRRRAGRADRSMRSPPSTSGGSVRSPAGATSTATRRWARFRPARPPCARCSASFRTPSSVRRSSTPRTDAIPISSGCRCTGSSSRSRIRSTRRTCEQPPAATRATTSTSPRAITCWSSSSATRGRSSSPRP